MMILQGINFSMNTRKPKLKLKEKSVKITNHQQKRQKKLNLLRLANVQIEWNAKI